VESYIKGEKYQVGCKVRSNDNRYAVTFSSATYSVFNIDTGAAVTSGSCLTTTITSTEKNVYFLLDTTNLVIGATYYYEITVGVGTESFKHRETFSIT
jgi:hypothetical protein